VIPTTSLLSTTPAVACPYPDELAVYDYSSSKYLMIDYPDNGATALRGSDRALTLPADGPRQISMYVENIGFLEEIFSVRRAKSVTLKLTLANDQTIDTEHPAADDAVS